MCHIPFPVAVERELINASEGPVLDVPKHIFSVNGFQKKKNSDNLKINLGSKWIFMTDGEDRNKKIERIS